LAALREAPPEGRLRNGFWEWKRGIESGCSDFASPLNPGF